MVDEVLEHALTRPLVPIKWDESDELVAVTGKNTDEDVGGLVTH
jgi:hypothetical protein